MVPKDWKHPVDAKGNFIPLHDNFSERLASWKKDKENWDNDQLEPYEKKAKDKGTSYEEWEGPAPEQVGYMPEWPVEQCTHYMMYKTCTEGSPISPACETPEELAQWLADNGTSSFGKDTATYEQWLAMIHRGSCISSAIMPGVGMISGVKLCSLKEV
jgi:hypothetical protein